VNNVGALRAEAASASVVRLESKLTWREMLARIRADRERLASLLRTRTGSAFALSLHPSFLCVFLYRISNYLMCRGLGLPARAVWQLNFLITGADISPGCDFGGGLLIISPAGTSLMGAAGKNMTVLPCSGIGGEMGNDLDVGAGPGLPLLQDNVLLEPHAGILGPVRVGNGVRVRAGVVLTKDAPDEVDVVGATPRFITRKGRE